MEEHIVLDKQSFKALAVDSRVDILKRLDQRRHTQSELSVDLGLSVPTIKEHLDALVKAGLVERQDDGHKWVYYALTKKGKAVINPEEKKFWIVLGVFVLTVVGAVTGMVRTRFAALYNPQFASVSAEAKMAVARDEAAPLMAAAPQAAPVATSAIPWGWIILGAVFLLELIILIYFWWRMREQQKLLKTIHHKEH